MVYVFGYLVCLALALTFNYCAHKINKEWDEANGFDYYRE